MSEPGQDQQGFQNVADVGQGKAKPKPEWADATVATGIVSLEQIVAQEELYLSLDSPLDGRWTISFR